MAALVGIVSRRGLRIKLCHRNQPNKSKLALCKPLLYFYSHLKQLYISNKIVCFSYEGGVVSVYVYVSRHLKQGLAWATNKRL